MCIEHLGSRTGFVDSSIRLFVYSPFICVHLRSSADYSSIHSKNCRLWKDFELFPQSLVIGIKFYSAFIMVACTGEIAHFVRCVSRVLVDDREIFAQAIYDRGIGIGLAKGFLPLR